MKTYLQNVSFNVRLQFQIRFYFKFWLHFHLFYSSATRFSSSFRSAFPSNSSSVYHPLSPVLEQLNPFLIMALIELQFQFQSNFCFQSNSPIIVALPIPVVNELLDSVSFLNTVLVMFPVNLQSTIIKLNSLIHTFTIYMNYDGNNFNTNTKQQHNYKEK